MGVYVRMILYFLSASLAGQGWLSFDAEAGTVTVQLEGASVAIVGAVGFLGTFLASRVGKRKGWST